MISDHRSEMAEKERKYNREVDDLKTILSKEKLGHLKQVKGLEENFSIEKAKIRKRLKEKEIEDIQHLHDDFDRQTKLLKDRY